MTPPPPPRTLLIACGALAREVLAVIRLNRWVHVELTCLPAILHNRPERIPAAVRRKIRANRARYDQIVVLYGDCGTGGALDVVLAEDGIERIPGPHCYAFFSGTAAFLERSEAQPGCFYVTDYLARHFERLVIQGLGLDRHPDLLPLYFGNYDKLVHLRQTANPALDAAAVAAAARLGLAYEARDTGFGELERFLRQAA